MVVIGEIQNGKSIGRKSSMKFMWCACIGCGKERWVMMVKGQPESDKCVICCKKGKKIVYHGNLESNGAKEGDIKTPRELGFGNKTKSKYVYAKCTNCGNLRWVQLKTVDKYKKCRKCMNTGKIKERSGTWNGGRKQNHSGYVMVHLYKDSPYFSMADANGYVFEHRLVMAEHLGRCLMNYEIVHHRDSIKSHNEITNLYLTDASNHNTLVEAVIKRQDAMIVNLKEEINQLKNQLSKTIDK